jgi:hypothetical protein
MVPALCDLALNIGIRPGKFTRKLLLTVLVVGALAISACGGDDEDSPTSPAVTATETEATESAPAETETETDAETEAPATETTPPTESPEDMPGGAGDEEPARSQALFTAAGGRVTPRVVRVPAFISVRVELRARDDGPYVLEIDGQRIEVGGQLSSGSVSLDGLRPGDAYVGTLSGAASGRVRVEATAEPGP